MLSEAQSNLVYAGADESGGFHNNDYVTLLMQDAESKAQQVESGVLQQSVTSLKSANVELKGTVSTLQNELETANGLNSQQTYIEAALAVCLVVSVGFIVVSRRKTV